MTYGLNIETEPFEAYAESNDEREAWDNELTDLEREEEIRRGRWPVRSTGLRPPKRPRQPPPRRTPRPRPWPPGRVVGLPVTLPDDAPPESAPPAPAGSEYIRWAQDSLNRILGLQLSVDGIVGPETRSAIRSFQKRQKLPVSGIIGPDTERALMAATASIPVSGLEELEVLDAESADLEREAGVDRTSREYIRWVQDSLNRILGLRLAVDGIMGPKTRSAVRRFQQQRGLAMDGIVGPRTERALVSAGARPPPKAAPATRLPRERPQALCPPSAELTAAERTALAVTTRFETGVPYGCVVSAVDGISMGMLQWNLAAGTLQELLAKFASQTGRLRVFFGAEADRVRQLIALRGSRERHQQAVAQAKAEGLAARWREGLLRLCADPVFCGLLIADIRQRMRHAQEVAQRLGLRTVRGLTMIFDIVVGDGLGKPKEQAFARHLQALGQASTEQQKLVAIAEEAARFAGKKLEEERRARRLLIANGRGRYRRSDWNLDRDFPTLHEPLDREAELFGTAPEVAHAQGLVDYPEEAFFARHPQRRGRKLEKGEPLFKALSQEWLTIRNRLVRPALRQPLTAQLGAKPPGAARTAVPVQTLKENIVRLANQEFERWGRGTIKETDPAGKRILKEYWKEGVRLSDRAADEAIRSGRAWSAAFISWIMSKAGADSAFRRSGSHVCYVEHAKNNRLSNNVNPFKAYRINEISPQVGDLVCKKRSCKGCGCTGCRNCVLAYDNVSCQGGLPSHCDIVTELSGNRLTLIGGNVGGSACRPGEGCTVNKKFLFTNASGYIDHPCYYAIIRLVPATLNSTEQELEDALSPTAGRWVRNGHRIVLVEA